MIFHKKTKMENSFAEGKSQNPFKSVAIRVTRVPIMSL
jgi:hypothetical protein